MLFDCSGSMGVLILSACAETSVEPEILTDSKTD